MGKAGQLISLPLWGRKRSSPRKAKIALTRDKAIIPRYVIPRPLFTIESKREKQSNMLRKLPEPETEDLGFEGFTKWEMESESYSLIGGDQLLHHYLIQYGVS